MKKGKLCLNGSAAEARRESGMTLLEIILAFGILALAALMMASVMFSTSMASEVNREMTLAQNVARTKLEEMRNEDFGTIFALYNDDPSDDPDGFGTAPGANFSVQDLKPAPNDPDGFVGRIDFPVINGQLREDFNDPALELPHDLTGDGAIDDQNHASDYKLLPVTVTIEWNGVKGQTRMFYRTRFIEK